MSVRTVFYVVLVSWPVVAVADTPVTGKDKLDISQILSAAGAGSMGGEKAAKSSFPKFEKVTKGMKPRKGLFTLWSYPPGTKDKDPEKLLCQIPKPFLGEKFMLSISYSGGGFFTGFPLEERVVQWKQLGRQLELVEPDSRFVVNRKDTVSDVVSRTHPERIRAAVAIVTKTKKGDPVIDLGKMLKSNFADVSWMSLGHGGMVNATLSQWTEKKAFELNVEIGVALAVSRFSPPGSYDKRMVHFSFWKLPQSGYKPRVADDRIGYFLTANQDWGKSYDSRDIFNRYIDRWQLEKRDSSLTMCEPKQPIIYYIEKTVPVRFRRAVRDGILEWNKAYEKVGFINAVEVRQQTDDNEWKDLDPEDMRYSFFRWIVTGAGFAMGPHRANPFTGQIYDADIVFDDSMVRFYEQQGKRMLGKEALAEQMSDPALEMFLKRFPQWKLPARNWEGMLIGEDETGPLRQAMEGRIHARGLHLCDYARGMQHQMAVGRAMLAGQPKEVIDKLLYDAIKEVVMHEVGHTLGLRHNFKGSTVYSLDEIRKRREKGQATCGSVMDYNPVLFFKDMKLDGHFITPTIGPYDYWAIEYGYRAADGSYKNKKATAQEGKEQKPDQARESEKKEASAKADAEAKEGSLTIEGVDIPEELLEQLPPKLKKMIEAQAARGSAGSGASPQAAAGPAFTGPNAAERGMLDAIASRAAEKELAYATDEDTTFLSPDPRSNRFDVGNNPLDWARSRMELVDQRMANILKWSVKDHESWYYMRQSFLSLWIDKVFVLDYVGRYVGGQYTSRSHRGDADGPPPFEMVPAKRQREALSFIEKNLFSDRFFSFSPEVLNHLAAPRWWHEGAFIDFVVDFPIHRYIGLLQQRNLFARLFPNTLRRIYDGELKTTGKDKLTLAEYLQRIDHACWSEVDDPKRVSSGHWSDSAPFLSSVRRSLQREYLGLMEPLVRFQPGMLMSPDIHAMLQHSLRKLQKRIEAVLATGNLDFASEAHLTASQSRIQRMLAPKLNEYGFRGS